MQKKCLTGFFRQRRRCILPVYFKAPMRFPDFSTIVAAAWKAYDPAHPIQSITDISVRVSTNYVYKVQLDARRFVIAKLSFFGQYEHFLEDHTIVNALAKSLAAPYQRFLAHSLRKDGKVFTYRFEDEGHDVWVVFYRPVKIQQKLPRRLEPSDIENLAREIAHFHKACHEVAPGLPHSSKTMHSDVVGLLEKIKSPVGKFEFGLRADDIRQQCERYLAAEVAGGFDGLDTIPVFVDWNIGNFSVTRQGRFFSRWDYDWFRVANRVMDFYFFSRVVSDVGDRTVFSYLPDTLTEERFLLFLKTYHAVYPLSEAEIRFIPEAYRFFILQYVIKFGNYFFHQIYANRLQQEAFVSYLPALDRSFHLEKLLKTCGM